MCRSEITNDEEYNVNRVKIMVQIKLPQTCFRRIWRALGEFELLPADNRVLVGLSGGKDSCFLLYALAAIRRYARIPLEITALTVDLGFQEQPDYQILSKFCSDLEIPFHILNTQIGKYITSTPSSNACATCSFLRRGAMVRWARENGFQTIALGHHLDDVVETFLMSILFSGQNKTFLPKTILDRKNVTIIRPLVYLREHEIQSTVKKFLPIVPLSSPCPFAGKTKRAETRTIIKTLQQDNRFLFTNLVSALRLGPETELWPPPADNKNIKKKCEQLKQKPQPKTTGGF